MELPQENSLLIILSFNFFSLQGFLIFASHQTHHTMQTLAGIVIVTFMLFMTGAILALAIKELTKNP
jgi:hypothetical protein